MRDQVDFFVKRNLVLLAADRHAGARTGSRSSWRFRDRPFHDLHPDRIQDIEQKVGMDLGL